MPSDELVDRAADALVDNVSRLSRRLRQRPLSGELTQPEAAALARLTQDASLTVADLAVPRRCGRSRWVRWWTRSRDADCSSASVTGSTAVGCC